jgi:hypothetical protein
MIDNGMTELELVLAYLLEMSLFIIQENNLRGTASERHTKIIDNIMADYLFVKSEWEATRDIKDFLARRPGYPQQSNVSSRA